MSLRKALLKRVKHLRRRLQHLQADASVANVHQFRIACRELLACTELLEPLTPVERWQPQVRQALSSLGRLRDLQQMRDWLLHNRTLPQAEVAGTFDAQLRKAHSRWEHFAPTLHTRSFRRALADLENALREKSRSTAQLEDAWQKQWRKTLCQVRKYLQTISVDKPDNLHRLRIRYKQLRYLLELQLDSGASIRVSRTQLRKWQDEFGQAVDYRVMAHYARKLQLPERLQRQYLRRAETHAQRCIDKSAAFATFLVRLERALG